MNFNELKILRKYNERDMALLKRENSELKRMIGSLVNQIQGMGGVAAVPEQAFREPAPLMATFYDAAAKVVLLSTRLPEDRPAPLEPEQEIGGEVAVDKPAEPMVDFEHSEQDDLQDKG